MEMISFEYIRPICELSRNNNIRKEIALIQIESKAAYMLGNFTEDNSCITGVSLTKKEVISLLNWAKENTYKKVMSEEEKFMQDYIQQAHNGEVKEREKELKIW